MVFLSYPQIHKVGKSDHMEETANRDKERKDTNIKNKLTIVDFLPGLPFLPLLPLVP